MDYVCGCWEVLTKIRRWRPSVHRFLVVFVFFLSFCRFAALLCVLDRSVGGCSFVTFPAVCCVTVFVSRDGEAHDFGSVVVRFQ